MNAYEIMMISAAFILCLISSITDIKTAKISNVLLGVFLIIGLVLNLLCYVQDQSFFFSFGINFLCMFICSIAMYYMDMWAAGDSKLLIVIMSLMPGKIIAQYDMLGSMPSVLIVIIAFTVSFIAVVAESCVIAIKRRELPDLHFSFSSIKETIRFFVCGSMYMLAFNMILTLLFQNTFTENITLLAMTNFIFAMLLFKIDFLFEKVALIITGIIFVVVFIFQIKRGVFWLSIRSLIMLTILMMFSKFSEKYNYETIETDRIRAGMILSSISVLNMQKSKIKGLPTGITEDMSCRLTEQEAQSVRRWGNSIYGKPKVTIVRKMPFALFLFIGTIIFTFGGIRWIYS